MGWRNEIPSVHAAADLFPMLDEAELRALGQDILDHGLVNPIAIALIKNQPQLLDGRNRLAALELVGIKVKLERTATGAWKLLAEEQLDGRWVGRPLPCKTGATVTVVTTTDATEYVISANINRRHLTTETKRDLIARLLKEHPERSNRATAKLVGVDNKTVAAVRRRQEDVRSIPHVDKVVDSKGRQQPSRKPKASKRRPPTAPTVRSPTTAPTAVPTERSTGLTAPKAPTNRQNVICQGVTQAISRLRGLPSAHEVVLMFAGDDLGVITSERVDEAAQWLTDFAKAWAAHEEKEAKAEQADSVEVPQAAAITTGKAQEVVAPPTAPTGGADYAIQVQQAVSEGGIPWFLRRQEPANAAVSDVKAEADAQAAQQLAEQERRNEAGGEKKVVH